MSNKEQELWNDKEVRALFRMKDQENKSWSEIGDELGRSGEACRSKYRHQNYTRKVDEEDGEGYEFYANENTTQIGKKVKDPIYSLDELLREFKVDLDVWEVDHWIANQWEMGYKDKHTQVADSLPLRQVKAWLVRKKPIAIKPVVTPVQFEFSAYAMSTYIPPRDADRVKIMDISDAHIGFHRHPYTGELTPLHDRRALDIVLQIAYEEKPDIIVVKGDWGDYEEWGNEKYIKSPEAYLTTQPSIVEQVWLMLQLKKYTSRMIFVEGNHEKRIENKIARHFLNAYELKPAGKLHIDSNLDLKYLLQTDEHEIEYLDDYPNNTFWYDDDLAFDHGVGGGAQPGGAVSKLLKDAQSSIGIGHLHRQEMGVKTVRRRGQQVPIKAWVNGCLCHVDGRVPGHKKSQNWQQGFTMLEYQKGRMPDIEFVYISEGEGYYRGQRYVGEDYVEQLRKGTKMEDGKEWQF